MIHVAAHSSYNTLTKMSKRIELFIFHPWFQDSSSYHLLSLTWHQEHQPLDVDVH